MKIVERVKKEYYYEKEDGTRTLIPIMVNTNEKKLSIKYNADGFDQLGYNADGFDHDGYDINGWDENGYDRNGCYRDGYDIWEVSHK